MSGYLYFIDGNGETSGIKIGFSKYPLFRLYTLQKATPIRLRLLGYVPALRKHETAVHALLKSYRMYGEWFCTKREVVRYAHAIINGKINLDTLPAVK